MKNKKTIIFLLSFLLISISIFFIQFRNWVNADLGNELQLKKLIGIFKADVSTSHYKFKIPKGYFILHNSNSCQIVVKYPISEKRICWANLVGGDPLRHQTDGIKILNSMDLTIDSLDRIIEMEVRIGTLDWMGLVDTIDISGRRFIGRTGAIVMNSGMKTISEGHFGIYYDHESKIWFEVWGKDIKKMITDFCLEFK